MITYPDKDEDLGVPDTVLALGHPDHWELGRTLTLGHQIPHLHNTYVGASFSITLVPSAIA